MRRTSVSKQSDGVRADHDGFLTQASFQLVPVLRPPVFVQLLYHYLEHHNLVARGAIATRPETLRRGLCIGGQSAESGDQLISDRSVYFVRKRLALIVISGKQNLYQLHPHSFAPVKLTCGGPGGCWLAKVLLEALQRKRGEVDSATACRDKFGQRLANGSGMFEAMARAG